MVAATITERTDTNSQGVTPAPDKLLLENNPQPSTTGPSSFNPRDIRKQIQAGVQAPAATSIAPTRIEQASSPTKTQIDLRADHVLKMQESFKQQALDNAPLDRRERLAASLKASQELVSQYQAVNEQIQTLGQNADPNTLKQLQARSELLIKQSAATLLQANTEHTINGIEQRQKELSIKTHKLREDVRELEKLEQDDPQRLAGILEVKKEQLKSLQETSHLLDTMRSSLSNSFETSNSFLQRVQELGREQPISVTSLAEATANIDSAILVLQDADEKTSLQAIDTGLQRLDDAHSKELERRDAFAQNIAQYDAQDGRLREASRNSINRAQSALNDATNSTADINKVTNSWANPYLPFASWVTGTTAAMESSRDNLLATADEQNHASDNLIERRKTVRRAKEEYIKLTRSGFEAEQQGDVDKAQTFFNHAQFVSNAASPLADPQVIDQVLTQPSKHWLQRNQEVTKKLDGAIASADKWESRLEVTRNVAVAAGATVATIATAGAGAGLFAAFAYGAGGGIAIGSLSNVAEQVTATTSGLKTSEQALKDFGHRFQKDAITSIEAAGTTTIGLGTGRAFQATSLANKLSIPAARTVSGIVGGTASGTSTTAVDVARTLYQRNEAIREFNSSPAAQELSPEQKQIALEEYLREKKLSLDDLAKRGIVNIGLGALGGGIGANTGALRDAAKTGLGKISTVLLDTAADAALGFGAVLITDGSISFEQGLAQSLQSVFVGNALSSFPARRARTQTTPSESLSAKVSYHEDPATLREQFISDSIKTLTTEKNRVPTPQETAKIEAEAKSVRAYENPQTGEVHVVKIDTDSMSRDERVRFASDIVHELAHRRGGDELSAHKTQFEYLLKNGYQTEVVDGQLTIRTLQDGETGTLPSDDQIKDYVARNYRAKESVAGMRLAKEEAVAPTEVSTSRVEAYKHIQAQQKAGTLTADELELNLRDLSNDPNYQLPEEIRNLLDSKHTAATPRSTEQIVQDYLKNREQELLEQGYSPEQSELVLATEKNVLELQIESAGQRIRRAAEISDSVTADLEIILSTLPEGAHARLEGLENKLKTEESLKRKIASEMTTDSGLGLPSSKRIDASLNDSLRYTVLLNSPEYTAGYHTVINKMQEAGYEVVKSKSSWPDTNARYVGINTTFRAPSGQLFEVQFHTPDSNFGNKITHPFYERSRTLKDGDKEINALDQISYDITNTIPRPSGVTSIESRKAAEEPSRKGATR